MEQFHRKPWHSHQQDQPTGSFDDSIEITELPAWQTASGWDTKGSSHVSFEALDAGQIAGSTTKSSFVGNESSNLNPASAPALPSSLLQPRVRKVVHIYGTALLAFAAAAVAVWFSHRVMVDMTELPRPLRLSPGAAVLVVNILSHIVAVVALSLFIDVTEQLRWALACRPQGVMLTTFLVLSRATPITGVFYLCRVRGFHQVWGLQRLAYYFATVIFSLILIANVTFKVVFIPTTAMQTTTIKVAAGLAPLSTDGLGDIDISLIPMLASAYSIAFLTDSRFAAKVAPILCSVSDPNCLSLLMPGGMEAVRVNDGVQSGMSLYIGDYAGDYDSILVNDAPGYHIEYASISSTDPSFRWNRTAVDGDCSMFGGDIAQGIYVCFREAGNSLHFGWTVCPDDVVQADSCQTNQSWTDDVQWNTTVSLFSRRATVAYNRANMSILSVEQLSEPIPVKVNASLARLYTNVVMAPIDKTLNWTADPGAYAYSAARANFLYGLSFLLRLYTSDYSTYRDGGAYLMRSFIAVPFQFATSMRQYRNISQMPPENSVTATLAQSQYRALIDWWTVWVFAWLAFPAIAYCVVLVVWMGVWGTYGPRLSAFPEIDMASRCGVPGQGLDARLLFDMDPHLEMAEQTLMDLGQLTRSQGMGDGNSLRIVRAIQGRRIYCGAVPASQDGREEIVLVTEEAGRLKYLNRTAYQVM